MSAEFGTNITCPRKGCKGELKAKVQSIEPLIYTYVCILCEKGGMWEQLVQMKGKVKQRLSYKHSFPMSFKDELELKKKRLTDLGK